MQLSVLPDAPASADPAAAIPAFAIGHITVKQPQQWAQYCSQVPATLLPWGGAVLVRGRKLALFNGVHPQTDTVVLRFPSAAAAAKCELVIVVSAIHVPTVAAERFLQLARSVLEDAGIGLSIEPLGSAYAEVGD